MNKVLNCILTAFLSLLLGYAWCWYFTKIKTLSIVCAVVISACMIYLCWFVCDKTKAKTDSKNRRRATLQQLFARLYLEDNCSALFAPILRYFGYTTNTIDGQTLTASKNGSNSFVAMDFSARQIGATQLRQHVINAKQAGCTKLVIFCNGTDSSATQVTSLFDVQLFDIAATADLMDNSNTMPQLDTAHTTQHNTLLATYAFNKKRFGWYTFSAIFLTATSFVSFFKIYNLLWATGLFALALYSLLNKRYNVPPCATTL